jgi:hypothetical protein
MVRLIKIRGMFAGKNPTTLEMGALRDTGKKTYHLSWVRGRRSSRRWPCSKLPRKHVHRKGGPHDDQGVDLAAVDVEAPPNTVAQVLPEEGNPRLHDPAAYRSRSVCAVNPPVVLLDPSQRRQRGQIVLVRQPRALPTGRPTWHGRRRSGR